MALSAAEVAKLKTKWQYFVCQFVAFDAITWDFYIPENHGLGGTAITWYPFCLISPRYSYTTVNGEIILYATDSYVRPTTAATDHTFAKVSGAGSVADNGDGTATVTAGAGITKVSCTVTGNGVTTTAYAYVYGGTAGNLNTAVAKVQSFSGSIATGEWEATISLMGDYSSALSGNGKNQPILMYVTHYWDGSADTFGGYKRHENTFVLVCRNAEVYEKTSGEYETVLKLETPAFALKEMYLGELRFSDTADSVYSSANLTPTDVAYFIMRETNNYHQEFNVSLWNNSSTIGNFTVRDGASVWEAVRECNDYSFGMAYMNRWSNFNAKPDPRVRPAEWSAIAGAVYDATNPLTTAHMLEYRVVQRRTEEYKGVMLQAVLPDMSIINGGYTTDSDDWKYGKVANISSLVVDASGTLDTWAENYYGWLNTPYELVFTLPMGHELNPGDLFNVGDINPTIGGADTVTATTWFCTDVSYQFDFMRGFWTRQVRAMATQGV
jgi:hypothetical protein